MLWTEDLKKALQSRPNSYLLRSNKIYDDISCNKDNNRSLENFCKKKHYKINYFYVYILKQWFYLTEQKSMVTLLTEV